VGEPRDVIDDLQGLLALDELSPANLGHVLGVTLKLMNQPNPNVVCHESIIGHQPWRRVELRSPAGPSARFGPTVSLEASDDCMVTRDEIEASFGQGELTNINPEQLPRRGGVISFAYTLSDSVLTLEYSYVGELLVGAAVGRKVRR
jgi:hypothetical protein